MFISRRLTQIYADKLIKNLRSSALICGKKQYQKARALARYLKPLHKKINTKT
jgi:hypothetical protein